MSWKCRAFLPWFVVAFAVGPLRADPELDRIAAESKVAIAAEVGGKGQNGLERGIDLNLTRHVRIIGGGPVSSFNLTISY